MEEKQCNQDCSNCCVTCDDEQPKNKDFFTQMEDMTNALHEEEGFGILEKVVAELETEQ